MTVRFLVDIDGVLADFQGGWIAAYEQWFDRPVPGEARGEWDCITLGTHFDAAEDFWAWSDIAGVWDQLPVVKGAQGALWEISKLGVDIQVATARHSKAGRATVRWLRHHFPFLNFQDGVAVGVKDKAAFAQRHDITVAIDDSPANLEALHEAGVLTIRYKRPWNSGVRTQGIVPAGTWHMAQELVRELWATDLAESELEQAIVRKVDREFQEATPEEFEEWLGVHVGEVS